MSKQSRRIIIKISGEIPEDKNYKDLEHELYYDFDKIDVKRIDLEYDEKE